jgi:N-acyl-D-amino-acid deacylase
LCETIVRGGTVVDGSGSAAYTADIAIANRRIAEVGQIRAPVRQVIDADGTLVTPGFIDIHTHLDGQFIWDDRLDPAFSHGVTTTIAGNCGVGLAPVQPDHRRALIELMEGVEEIPGIVLEGGVGLLPDRCALTYGLYLGPVTYGIARCSDDRGIIFRPASALTRV